MRTYGDTPYTETITTVHVLRNNEGENIIFQLTKGRYDEALMIGSHHRRERDRGMQLSLVLLGKDYTHTNTQIYKYTQLFNLSFITETQIQNTGTCLAKIIQIHTGPDLIFIT